MKAVKFAAFLLFLGAGLLVTSCSEDEDENTATITFEGARWNTLIDDPQYGGQLLYGDNASTYSWTESFTHLTGGMTNSWGGYYGFSEGGTAISNYVDDNLAEHATYMYQLAVPVSNGSSNFAVVYAPATLSFKDNVARQIKSMDICPTTYLLGMELNGDGFGFTQALTTEDSYLTLTITADTGVSMDVDLARDGDILQTWKQIDLSALGAVKSISFSMSGSDTGDYGLNTPAYFAFDNVVVVL